MKKNRFEMDAYAGAVIQSGFYGELVFDISGIRTPDGNMPALREHDRLRPVGIIDKTLKSEQIFNAFGFFIDTKDGKEIQSQLDQGFPLQASVGVWIDEIEVLAENESALVNGREFSGDVIIRKSFCREISAVTLGADSATKFEKSLSLSQNVVTDDKNAREKFQAAALAKTKQPELKEHLKNQAAAPNKAQIWPDWQPNCGPLSEL